MTKATVPTDSYCTPLWLSKRVGTFYTDPCTNPRAHVVALVRYMLETGHDGLSLPWHGRVWMNHPYSDPMPWMLKLHAERKAGHCTESLVLAKFDSSTEWWDELTNGRHGACEAWLLKKRLQHDIPPEVLAEMQRRHEAKGGKGKVPTSNNFPSVLVHHRSPHPDATFRQVAPMLDLHDVARLWIPG